jgi:hypothetical protein
MTNPLKLSVTEFPLGDHGSLAVNASGTRLAAAKPMGNGSPVDLTNPSLDTTTLIPNGPDQWLTIKSALAMGILRRSGSDLIETLPPIGTGSW